MAFTINPDTEGKVDISPNHKRKMLELQPQLGTKSIAETLRFILNDYFSKNGERTNDPASDTTRPDPLRGIS